jgi:hypothetical protein
MADQALNLAKQNGRNMAYGITELRQLTRHLLKWLRAFA